MSKILICDDDPILRELVELRLQGKGYVVTCAADGNEAIKAVERDKPDLIVLDASMPGMDGFQVLAVIKSGLDTLDIPVVMLTARNQSKDVAQAVKQGADDYLVKPFQSEDLLGRIALHLARAKSAERENAPERSARTPAGVKKS